EIGALRATRGAPDCDAPLGQSLRMFDAPRFSQAKGVALSLLAQSSLWRGEADAAGRLADAAWELAGVGQLERDFARAARLQGQAALGTADLHHADERLYHALTHARAIDAIEEELPILTALAVLYGRRGDTTHARDLLDGVWDAAERGPYPLLHADA